MKRPVSLSPGEEGGFSRLRFLIIGALVVVLVAGVTLVGKQIAQTAKTKQETLSAAAALETIGPIPAWLTSADPKVMAEYAWALNHHKELQYIPCYCGCETFGHKDNSTCYFKRDAAGKVTGYEEHALT